MSLNSLLSWNWNIVNNYLDSCRRAVASSRWVQKIWSIYSILATRCLFHSLYWYSLSVYSNSFTPEIQIWTDFNPRPYAAWVSKNNFPFFTYDFAHFLVSCWWWWGFTEDTAHGSSLPPQDPQEAISNSQRSGCVVDISPVLLVVIFSKCQIPLIWTWLNLIPFLVLLGFGSCTSPYSVLSDSVQRIKAKGILHAPI